MKRVVVTGIGIISSIGNNKQEVLNSLKSGKSGIKFSEKFKEIGMKSHVCGNVEIDINGKIDRKFSRFMAAASTYSYLSMLQAIEDAKLTDALVSNELTGIIVGSGGGSPITQVAVADGMREKGLRGVGPYAVPKTMSSGVSACLGTFFKIKGINYSITSACTTSAHCIGNAFEQIQMGKQNIIFAGGGEELSWEMACQFDAMGGLSTKYNDFPEKSSRAYDSERDGFVIAEGGAILVLEELEHALARGAKIYAEIVGYGATSDGAEMVSPSGEGAVRSMKMALKTVKAEVDYINTHGTSTPLGDTTELGAISEVFGNKIPKISSTKSMTGHSLGAIGAQEAIFTLLMLENGFIAPSINIEKLDERVQNMNIITKTEFVNLKTVLSNSFGFGGTNATLIFQKYEN